jgi:hypothetical protein
MVSKCPAPSSHGEKRQRPLLASEVATVGAAGVALSGSAEICTYCGCVHMRAQIWGFFAGSNWMPYRPT